jgi:hypothetical protein
MITMIKVLFPFGASADVTDAGAAESLGASGRGLPGVPGATAAAATAGATIAGAAMAGEASSKRCPQLPQNLASSFRGVWQDGHSVTGGGTGAGSGMGAARLVPHLLQNFVPSGFSAPHCGQFIVLSVLV